MGSKQPLNNPSLNPSLLMQAKIRENATEVQNFLSDLNSWTKEMKATELAASNQTIPQPTPLPPTTKQQDEAPPAVPPLRNTLVNKNKTQIPPPPARGDYKAWEKFDVEKACEQVDEGKEQLEMTAKLSESDEDGIRRRAIELRLLKLANEKKDLGNQCLKDKEYRKAIEHYSAGIVADKKNAVLYANRAQAYMYLKEYDKAIEDCSSSIDKDVGYVKAYFRRAKAKFNLGCMIDAKADLKHVLTLEPGNVEAKLLQNEISKKTMASLLTPGPGTKLNSSSNSAPSTPISSYFPGVTTRLGAPCGASSTTTARGGGGGGGGGLFGNLRRSATLPLYSSSCASNYDDDDEDMGGGGLAIGGGGGGGGDTQSQEIYPKIINPIYKAPSKRSKRPLLPVHVKVIGGSEASTPISSPTTLLDQSLEKKMRLDLDCNGNKQQQEQQPLLPQLFSQLQMTPVFDEGNKIPPKPTTAAQFNLDWRKIKGNSETCAQYLKQLNGSDYASIFGESLEYSRLSEILECLLWEFLPRGWPIRPHLEGLSTVPRFSTLVLFMSQKDRANARKLVSEAELPSSKEEQVSSTSSSSDLYKIYDLL